MTNKLRFIDLFAGAGGLSEGFIRAGFEPVAHVEIDTAAANTMKTRMVRHWLKDNNQYKLYENYLQRKITREELWNLAPKELIDSVINIGIGKENNPEIFNLIDALPNSKNVDLIIGGPPCQAYSLAGRSRDKNGMIGDERNYLYKFYIDFLKKYQPKYFVFENVVGLLSAKDEDGSLYFKKMRKHFNRFKYRVEYKVLDASEYGVPQQRKRVILVGKFMGKPIYPEPEKCEIEASIKDLFADLPSIQAGGGTPMLQKYKKKADPIVDTCKLRDSAKSVTWHIARPNNEQDLEIYKIAVSLWMKKKMRLNYNNLPEILITHKNRNAHLDRFKVVAGDLRFSHTVVAHIAKDGHYYIHPDIKQNRSLTPREAARLQTFPDDYYFEGVTDRPSRTAAFKQIGNAVPVLLGEKVALKLMEVW